MHKEEDSYEPRIPHPVKISYKNAGKEIYFQAYKTENCSKVKVLHEKQWPHLENPEGLSEKRKYIINSMWILPI